MVEQALEQPVLLARHFMAWLIGAGKVAHDHLRLETRLVKLAPHQFGLLHPEADAVEPGVEMQRRRRRLAPVEAEIEPLGQLTHRG